MSAPQPGKPRARDPYGIGPVGSFIAPAIAVVGLVVIAILTVGLMNGQVPFVGAPAASSGQGGGNGGITGPQLTPAPSNVVIVEPDVAFKGSFVYAKAGNIWIQTAKDAKQLTSSGNDSMPSWSPDGQYVYYIHSRPDQNGLWPDRGVATKVALDVNELTRIKADGSGSPERLTSGRFKKGRYTYAYWIRQPVVSPDGSSIAIISDAPDPTQSDIVLQFFDPKSGKIRSAKAPESGSLGHQDPEWRPDGRFLVFVRNARQGQRGTPSIYRYDPSSKKAKALTTAGYNNPSYSPDGNYLAATRTTNLGTDVVILDANNGRELTRITNDGASFAPSWSPAGDGIAYLHLSGSTVDLELATLDGPAGDWTVKDTKSLTEVSGLDPASRPDWYIPASDLPAPTPTPVPTPGPSGSAKSSGSAGSAAPSAAP